MTDTKPTRRYRYVFFALVALCVAAIGAAHAAGLTVTSQQLTVSQNPATVPCVVDVTMSNQQFTPATVTITPGCSVRWTNTQGNHSSTSDGTSGNTVDPWDSGVFGSTPPANTFTKTLNTAGTYNYFCSVHRNAGMVGTVVVDN